MRVVITLSLICGLVTSQQTIDNDVDNAINSIFGEPLPPGVPFEDNCPGGECVAFNLCNNGTFVTNGEGIINIRFSDDSPLQCRDYLQTCCRDIIEEPIVPEPINVGCGYRLPNGLAINIPSQETEAKYSEFPWMAAVLRLQEVGDKIVNVFICGASLIHPHVVLTAAHCVGARTAEELVIRAGEWDTQTTNEPYPHQDRDVAKITIHPDYYSGALYNDIALLYLTEPVVLSQSINTVCLPPPNHQFDNLRCFASGWGKDIFGKEGKYQVVLKKIELPVVPRNQCQNKLRTTRLSRRFNLHASFICAGGETGKDTCKGDGGSPLVCPISNQPERYYQAGIVAWGIGCGENGIPGVYAGVAQFRNWIDEQFLINKLETSYYSAV